MMPHWCGEETAALVAGLPFLAFAWRWLKGKLRRDKKDEHQSTGHDHSGDYR